MTLAQFNAFPYLHADPTHFTIIKDWYYKKGNEYISLDSLAEDWDLGSIFEIAVELQVDFPQILRNCGLDESASLRLAIGWRSSGTMLRGNGAQVDLDHANTADSIVLKVRVDAADVTHDLTLITALVLTSPGQKPQQLAPSLPGSLLWSLEKRIVLDSDSFYFPIVTIDFRTKAGTIPADSLWYLEWDPNELDQNIYSSILLYLNTAHTVISQSVSTGNPLPEFVDQFLLFDIARSLIVGALSNPEFVEDPSQYAEGSIGALIYDLLCTYFPEETAFSLFEKRSNAGLFEAFLQHHLAFLQR